MELSQLRYFKAVAEVEHFTRAAELLHLSQPSLSKSISTLEAELGVSLFERTKRSVYLNENGRTLLRHVNKILAELDDAQAELRDLTDGVGGDIRIASCAVFSEPSPIYAYTTEFFLTHPTVGLHTYIQSNNQIQEMLTDQVVDFGYSMLPSDNVDIESVELLDYRLGLAVPKSHPLAQRGEVYLRELENEQFLCNNTSMELTDSVYELCHKAGFKPKVLFEGESASLIGRAISEGIGVAFISDDRHAWQHNRFAWENEIAFLHVKDDFCSRTVYLYQLKDRYLSKAAQEFRAGLLDFVQRQTQAD